MKKLSKALAAIMLMMTVVFAAGCGKDDHSNNGGGNNNSDNNENVMVITTTPKDITSTSAVCGGSVSVSEGIALSEVGVCWSTSSTPTVAGSHLAAERLEEQFTCTVVGLESNTKYYVCAYAMQGQKCYYGSVKDFTTLNNSHDYVDLGLPSGTLWATCNVGATKPEEYGDYFAWAETEPKDVYNLSNYKYWYSHGFTKYCGSYGWGYNSFVDNLSILLPEDDAATANWSNDWCMPTMAQWEELYQNINNTWTTQNGVYGRLFIASNGNRLFLPAAGFSAADDNAVGSVGSVGLYWANSLYNESDVARNFYIDSGECRMVGYPRHYGLSVRPVHSAK